MAITGTGAVEREYSVLLIQINGIWYPIGEDNESMERTRNNTVTQTKNVLGKTKTKVVKGNQVQVNLVVFLEWYKICFLIQIL